MPHYRLFLSSPLKVTMLAKYWIDCIRALPNSGLTYYELYLCWKHRMSNVNLHKIKAGNSQLKWVSKWQSYMISKICS